MVQMAPVQAYHAPTTMEECLGVLRDEAGHVVVLAGGQSVLPLLKARQLRPEVLLDLGRVGELRALDVPTDPGSPLVVGAMVRYREIVRSDVIAKRWSALADAAVKIGDLQIQNRGTLGGNIAFGTATTDLKQVVMALSAELVIAGPDGLRTSPARELFADPHRAMLEAGELLQEVRFPALPARSGSAYVKVGLNANGRPVVGVAAVLTLDAEGVCSAASVVVGGIVPAPCVAERASQLLVGEKVDAATIASAAGAAADEAKPQSDSRASSDYRRQLIRVYGGQALERALSRAQEG